MDSIAARRPGAGLNILVLIAFLGLTLTVGFVAGQVTAPNIATWYAGLAKPSFNPPNWIFAPVWTALYVVMAVSAWLVWRRAGFKSTALLLWLSQLALNFAWSLIFFGTHQPLAALIELIALWLAIFATVIAFGRIERLAGWLMIPYLGWVTFAGLLTYWVWRLNG